MDASHAAATAISPAAYWIAGGIFVTTFAIIISDKLHKTKVALLGAALTILLGVTTQVEAFHSPHLGVDYNVIYLLISMMLLVNILGKTGAFEWMAIKLAKVARGEPLRLMILFAIGTATASAFLDNVTTVLLVAPVTLLICDELDIDCVPFLIMEAIASNIGGTATLVGDPPNLIIASRAQFSFMDFIVHLAPVVVIMMIAFVIVLKFWFKGLHVDDAKKARVMTLDESGAIKNKPLLIKSALVMGLTLIGFLVHHAFHLEPASIALGGAAILLLISGLDPHEVLAEIEWSTLFFFIGLFIIIGGVVKVGIVTDLSNLVIKMTAPTEASMMTTTLVILWFSAFLSAVIDNIPYVATMAPLVADMAGTVLGNGQTGANVPVEVMHHPTVLPVWWALALGACLGGNGTAIGASANVVVLGMAERAGKKVSFIRFMKFGMPVMILTIIISHIYLYVRYYM